jgi:hypothetical protein
MIKLGLILIFLFFIFGGCQEKKNECDLKIETDKGKKLPYYEGNYKENKDEYMDTESSK